MNRKPSIVFFGSGPVAARSLELLLENFLVEAVVTKPKPPHHRGEFPVLSIAKNNNLRIIEVTDKKSTSTAVKNAGFSSELGVLIDFGIIVSQSVIDSFEKGIVNSHFSLLPQWRGADPITFSILSGQEQTGVSLMLLVEAMDEGPLLSVGIVPLDGTETTPSLTSTLIHLSNSLLAEQVPLYLNGKNTAVSQDDMKGRIADYPSEASYSRKLVKSDGILDFSKPAEVLEREVRAYQQWPKSRTTIGNVDVVVLQTTLGGSENIRPEGTMYITEDKQIGIQTTKGSLIIEKLCPDGKKPMDTQSFLRGYENRIRIDT
ncbi:methionyl-tRNA formyltransferase [Candidatus Saccharibacteria bacterium]|nr:methionyl-tRNA formyltransferase [Candidatus Saccharibacteria bacterium]